MATKSQRRNAEKEALRKERQRERAEREAEARRVQAARTLRLRVAGVLAVALVALGAVFLIGRSGDSPGGGEAGEYAFEVGTPGPGERAPDFQLTTTEGEEFDLGALRGKTVLLYFQEGIGCQPCWDQMTDIEDRFEEFQALGIDEMVTVTVDELDDLRRKVGDEAITSTVLADPDVSLGDTYTANQYGMMGTSTYGHTFIVVGPDGEIRWRADYGGSPEYTMYVRPDALLEDLRAGLAAAP